PPPRQTALDAAATLEQLLTLIADCLEEVRLIDDLDTYVERLRRIDEEITTEERHRGQTVIQKRGLLTDRFQLPVELRRTILETGYGSPLTSDAIERIARHSGGMNAELLAAMREMKTADHVADILLAHHCGKADRNEVLDRVGCEELIDAAD